MDSIHTLFATYVLPGRQIPGDITPAQSQRTTPDADPFHSGGRTYELIRRVHILHHQARQERTLSVQTISQALQVWNELERWDPSEGTSTPEQFRLNNAYRSAIFIWTYFTIYPRDIHGWKPQDAVRDILADVPAVGDDDGELVRLAGIPLFFCALSVTDEGERGVIRSEYERVRLSGGRGLDASWGIVQRQWRRYDAGDRESWDWVE